MQKEAISVSDMDESDKAIPIRPSTHKQYSLRPATLQLMVSQRIWKPTARPRMQAIWNDAMSFGLNQAGDYISVSVLIVHWAEALDEDLDARSEVAERSHML